MTLEETQSVIENAVESEDLTFEDVMEWDLELTTDGTVGVVDSVDVEFIKTQQIIKFKVSLY